MKVGNTIWINPKMPTILLTWEKNLDSRQVVGVAQPPQLQLTQTPFDDFARVEMILRCAVEGSNQPPSIIKDANRWARKLCIDTLASSGIAFRDAPPMKVGMKNQDMEIVITVPDTLVASILHNSGRVSGIYYREYLEAPTMRHRRRLFGLQ